MKRIFKRCIEINLHKKFLEHGCDIHSSEEHEYIMRTGKTKIPILL